MGREMQIQRNGYIRKLVERGHNGFYQGHY